jgi:hypothetical protein
MKSVVADGLVRCLRHPGIESFSQGLAFVLNGKVNQRRGPAERRGPCARFKVVGACRACKGHIEMSMNIDSPGKNQLARRVQRHRSVLSRQFFTYGNNLAVFNCDVRCISIGCCHQAPVRDDCVKAHRILRPPPGERWILC